MPTLARLKVGGRLVISFRSLEDRIVKQFMVNTPGTAGQPADAVDVTFTPVLRLVGGARRPPRPSWPPIRVRAQRGAAAVAEKLPVESRAVAA